MDNHFEDKAEDKFELATGFAAEYGHVIPFYNSRYEPYAKRCGSHSDYVSWQDYGNGADSRVFQKSAPSVHENASFVYTCCA